MGKLVSICVFFVASIGFAGDWPSFRGPARDGVSTEHLFPAERGFGFKEEWRQALGSGYAGISVVGDVAVTMFTDGTSDIVLSFDSATGKERWRHVIGPMYKGHSGSHDGPTGTPTLDRDMVFALDPHGRFVALSLADGSKKWGFQLGNEVVARVPHYGFNTVPAVVGDAVIIMTGEKGRALTAFDRSTGKEIWSAGDDTTTYQSPTVWEHDGNKRLLAVTDNFLMELDPSNGTVIWQDEHKVNDDESYALPVWLDKDTLLIQDRRQVAAFRLDMNEGKGKLSEIWRNNVFNRTYALPVVSNGLIFGYRAQFLHCVDAKTGEVKWRSRPPGGQGLTLVDGHVLIIGSEGELVAIEASGDGYKEKARLQLFKGDSYTPVTVANGKLYLRDLHEMVRVSVTNANATAVNAATTMPELKGEFGKFVTKLMTSTDKSGEIDAYLAKHPSPIIEAGGLVTYVFRGEIEDIAVSRANVEHAMFRVPETDLYFYSETLDEQGHWIYTFSVFGERRLDQGNPLVVDDQNELRMPRWKAPDFFGSEAPRGEVVERMVKTTSGERKCNVYLPNGYAQSQARYPVVYIPNLDALNKANLDVALNNLIAMGRVAPILAVFIDITRAEANDPSKYIEDLTKSIVPAVDAEFRSLATPASRGLLGFALGAVMNTLAFIQAPEMFGKLGVQSFLFYGPFGDQMKTGFAQGPVPSETLVLVSTNDYKFPGLDAFADSQGLVEVLRSKNSKVTRIDNAGAPSWANWRAQCGDAFQWFAPAK